MKHINTYICERLHINKDIDSYNYHPKTKNELKQLVYKLIIERGYDADLNDIDTSEIIDISYMFNGSYFNGDISEWDVSKVKYMWHMFFRSPLEKNPPKWYKE